MNEPLTIVSPTLPEELAFLLEMHPYKVAYGGRFGLKTRSFAIALLVLGAMQPLRIVCFREIMKSIKESVHAELEGQIKELSLTAVYEVLNNEIRGPKGTKIMFAGLSDLTAESIKSFSNVDIAWIEEAQTVTKRSWDILIPTVRKPNSEIWVSFNPDMDTDDTYQRWVVQPPPGTIVVKTGWETAQKYGLFPERENQKRLHMHKTDPVDYENIWGGRARTSVAGAIYARQITDAIENQRIRAVPYDPRLPVHTVWDLGWNDAMSIIMVQKPVPSVLNVVNYMEDSFRTYAEFVADLNALGYVWGFDWLPHDAENKNPQTGTNAKQMLKGLGRKVKIIPRSDPEARIRAARMLFPRAYIDNTERRRPTGYLGGARLIECLKRYRRAVPATTGEPAGPVHDEYSHAADAFGGLAEIVDQIRNAADVRPPPVVPRYRSTVRGAGLLG